MSAYAESVAAASATPAFAAVSERVARRFAHCSRSSKPDARRGPAKRSQRRRRSCLPMCDPCFRRSSRARVRADSPEIAASTEAAAGRSVRRIRARSSVAWIRVVSVPLLLSTDAGAGAASIARRRAPGPRRECSSDARLARRSQPSQSDVGRAWPQRAALATQFPTRVGGSYHARRGRGRGGRVHRAGRCARC
jgi:hypothetical protein